MKIKYPLRIYVLFDKDGIPVTKPRLTMEDAEAAKLDFRGFVTDIKEYDLSSEYEIGSIFDGAEEIFENFSKQPPKKEF